MADLVTSGIPVPLLSIHLQADYGNLAIVTLSGELDHSNEQEARREIDRLLKRGITCLVFDLSRLNFMDSSGVTLLVRVYSTLIQRQGTLALIAPCPLVQRILNVVQLTPLVPIYPTAQQALSDLAHILAAPASPPIYVPPGQ